MNTKRLLKIASRFNKIIKKSDYEFNSMRDKLTNIDNIKYQIVNNLEKIYDEIIFIQQAGLIDKKFDTNLKQLLFIFNTTNNILLDESKQLYNKENVDYMYSLLSSLYLAIRDIPAIDSSTKELAKESIYLCIEITQYLKEDKNTSTYN